MNESWGRYKLWNIVTGVVVAVDGDKAIKTDILFLTPSLIMLNLYIMFKIFCWIILNINKNRVDKQ